jgi:sulfur relay (sulfurtransferase) complex TusBCD TusD component (DsrE family)
MATKVPHTDVLMTVMGSPHESDLVTSVLRLAQSLLERGASVQIWACGYATMLTQQGLGPSKPRNLAEWSTEYPSMAAVVQDMLAAFPDRLHWYACRFCSDDRGAIAHIPEVPQRAPAKFAEHVAAADKTLFLGVM